MEPNHSNEQLSATELPHFEQSSGHIYASEKTAAAPEVRGQQQSTASALTANPFTAPSSLPPNNNPTPAATVSSSSASAAVPLTADDADLIEKEWVLKAKAIVMETKNDPRAQNIQMNGIKADYLKKRYNRDLKISES